MLPDSGTSTNIRCDSKMIVVILNGTHVQSVCVGHQNVVVDWQVSPNNPLIFKYKICSFSEIYSEKKGRSLRRFACVRNIIIQWDPWASQLRRPIALNTINSSLPFERGTTNRRIKKGSKLDFTAALRLRILHGEVWRDVGRHSSLHLCVVGD